MREKLIDLGVKCCDPLGIVFFKDETKNEDKNLMVAGQVVIREVVEPEN